MPSGPAVAVQSGQVPSDLAATTMAGCYDNGFSKADVRDRSEWGAPRPHKEAPPALAGMRDMNMKESKAGRGLRAASGHEDEGP